MAKVKNALIAGVFGLGLPLAVARLTPCNYNLTQYMPDTYENPYVPQVSNIDFIDGPFTPFIIQYKDAIVDAGNTNNVPPEIIAGMILEENVGNHFLNNSQDYIARAWNHTLGPFVGMIDPSLGVGQVNVSTAQSLDDFFFGSHVSYELTEQKLLDPNQNIHYMAMMLSSLMNRPNRQLPEGKTIFQDPHYIAIIGTEYVTGPTNTSLEEAQPTYGLWAVLYTANLPCIRIFGSDATITERDQTSLRNYAQNELAKFD